MDEWFQAQTKFQTWSANFVQTRYLPTLADPLTSNGKVWVSLPNRFRWELGEPAQTIVIRKPEQLMVIYPRLKRAEKYPLDTKQTGPWKDAVLLLEAGFPSSRTDLERQFNVLSTTLTNATWRVRLQPKAASTRRFLPEIEIGLSTNDFSLTSTSIKFQDGARLHNQFSALTNEISFPPHWLDERLEADFQITEPAGK